MKDLSENNLQSCFNEVIFTELTRVIKGHAICNWIRLVNSYQQFWREQIYYYERLNESDGLSFCSFSIRYSLGNDSDSLFV